MRKAAISASSAIAAQAAKPQRAAPVKQLEYLPVVAHASACLGARGARATASTPSPRASNWQLTHPFHAPPPRSAPR